MSVSDAVDGSSTGTGVPGIWVLLRRPRFEGAKSCKRLRQLVSTSRSRFFRFMASMRRAMSPCVVGSSGATCWPSSRNCRRAWLVSKPCASSHHRSRELQALGHTVRLMPPAYVKPYVKRHKNDAVDAEAICEAVTRANMRFVATKTPEQQSCLTLHRTRHLFIRQQTSVINAIRAHLAEFGIVAPVGRHGVEQLLGVVADADDRRLPDVARACVAALGAQLRTLKAQILQFDRMIRAWHRSSEASRRLDDIPGVGPALATALVASVADPKVFRSGRDFSAWIGLGRELIKLAATVLLTRAG